MNHHVGQRPLVVLLGCAELRPPLKTAGFGTTTFRTAKRLVAQVAKIEAQACVVRADAVEASRVPEVIRALRRKLPFSDVVIWAPRGRAPIVRDALTSGARDVVLASSPTKVVDTVQRVVEEQKILPRLQRTEKTGRDRWRFEEMVSRSGKMWDIFETSVQIAPTDAPVLIFGETGTGKELLARAIHRRSGRKGRFVALNCGAVPETLIDSQLFGHVKGAFTGATGEQRGLFQHAHGGTLFLDEIGNIPLVAQHRLLRALQEGAVRPVGGDREIEVDARVIAATSANLEETVTAGEFRADLLYRLDVIRVALPPLRERPEDILPLLVHFFKKYVKQYKLKRPEWNESFLDALLAYHWPGNIRQLENYTERLLLTQRSGELTAQHFSRLVEPFEGQEAAPNPAPAAAATNPAPSAPAPNPAPNPAPAVANPNPAIPPGGPVGFADRHPIDLEKPLTEIVSNTVQEVEQAYIRQTLEKHQGRIGDTAHHAGISRRTLLRKMKEYNIDKRAFRRA